MKKTLLLLVLVSQFVFTLDDRSMEHVLGDALRSKGKTIGLAESCTGGTLASLITSVSGASEYFKGSIVSYAVEAKENLLDAVSKFLSDFQKSRTL